MTITLNLEPEIEKGLLAQAATRGVSLVEYVNQIVVREAHISAGPSQPRTGQDLTDASARIRGLLTDEEVDALFSRNPSLARPVDFE
jgi:hypothetical protein